MLTLRRRDPGPSAQSHLHRSASRVGVMVETAPKTCGITRSTHALAVEATKLAKLDFHQSLPPSLLAENEFREPCRVAPFKWDECVLGTMLGSGDFSDVFEVNSFHLNYESMMNPEWIDVRLNHQWSGDEFDQRSLMKERERRSGSARYALKRIKPALLDPNKNREEYANAISDLALEKELLTSLSHPNIIKLRGIAYSGPTGFALVIDRLVETLDQRIVKWRRQTISKRSGMSRRLTRSLTSLSASFTRSIKAKSESEDSANDIIGGMSRSLTRSSTTLSASFMRSKSKDTADEIMDNRLSIAFQIAAALSYLASHGLVYRDLKPHNIGFDVRGDTKIFDFGLARFCPEDGDPNNDTFCMSGAGTPRYMAPECLRGDAYNVKADVYSFAIVLWEILSGQAPYAFARRRHQLIHFVVEEHGRPDIDPSWPSAVQEILKRSFDAEIRNRLEMEQVYKDLREVLVSLRNGERTGLDDSYVARRRSLASNLCLDEAGK